MQACLRLSKDYLIASPGTEDADVNAPNYKRAVACCMRQGHQESLTRYPLISFRIGRDHIISGFALSMNTFAGMQ